MLKTYSTTNREHVPLTMRNLMFLFRQLFRQDIVTVRHDEARNTLYAFFNSEAEPRYQASSASDLWDAVMDDRIQQKTNDSRNS